MAEYCEITKTQKTIENVKFYRREHNRYKTFFVRLDGQYNIELRNMEFYTPNGSLYGDGLIRIYNSSNIYVKNIKIDGTYSRVDKYGYGINLHNVGRIEFKRLKGKGNWGVFGTRNLRNVTLEDCEINRFDIHNYGKDIEMTRCKFFSLYNSFSSMFGKVSFLDCESGESIPVLFGRSYNPYTKYELTFKNCKVRATVKNNFLISRGDVIGSNPSARTELQEKYSPDLYIDGLEIELPENEEKYYIYKLPKRLLRWSVDEIPNIKKKKDVRIVRGGTNVLMSNQDEMASFRDIVHWLVAGTGLGAICLVYWIRNSRENERLHSNSVVYNQEEYKV